ncbi:TPA: plasmid recombination protein, partial [Escherichia coli]|nr:plasmid recombination protein [Escherichia coli]HBH8239617.1 plasmid recombination protein [Escherichia coli]
MAANNKAIQVRIDYLTAANAGHQHAHELRIGPQPEYVDEKRAHLNRILIEPLTGSQLRKISEERRSLRKVQRGMKSNAAVGISGIITFGHKAQLIFEALPIEKQDEAYWEVAERIAVRLNTTLTGLVSHGDETSPHAHFQCPGFTLDGQPVSAIAKREAMRDIQDIAAEVIKQYAPEIERGKSRWQRIKEGETYADTVHKSGAMMRHLLPEAIAEKERELSEKTEALQNTDAALKAVSADLEKATTELEKTIVALAERREYLDVQN